MTKQETRTLIDAAWANSDLFRWRQGDLLVLDNIRMGHGRLNVDNRQQAQPRRIAVAMADGYDVTQMQAAA